MSALLKRGSLRRSQSAWYCSCDSCTQCWRERWNRVGHVYVTYIMVCVCHFLTSGKAVEGEADFAAPLNSAIAIKKSFRFLKMATVVAMVYARQFAVQYS